MSKEETNAYVTVSRSGELISLASSSEIPSMVKAKIAETEETPVPPARRILGIPLSTLGVNSNPYKAYRARTFILYMTAVCWSISLLLLCGAMTNFYLLEQIEISATSHDARIEATAAPIKIGDL
jgi:hypothetical protein